MPASIAAWSTVRPLATVRERPSIVSVTVSISWRSYQFGSCRSELIEFGDCRLVAVNLHLAHLATHRHRPLHDALGDRHDEFLRPPVGECHGDGHGNIEDELPFLF